MAGLSADALRGREAANARKVVHEARGDDIPLRCESSTTAVENCKKGRDVFLTQPTAENCNGGKRGT